MSSKRNNGRQIKNPCQRNDCVPIEKKELGYLIRTKVERDILLNAYVNNCASYIMDDILNTICKINGIEVKVKDA